MGTGAMCDPYNPFEEQEQLTRHSLELLDAFEFGVHALTKSSLIARDADIFCSIAEHSPVLCQVTVTAAEDSLSALVEPNVSSTSERFEAIAKMSENGLFTGIVIALFFINRSGVRRAAGNLRSSSSAVWWRTRNVTG